MNTIEKKRGPGGAQPGAGRPKGSTNKVTIESIIAAMTTVTGVTYEHQIASNYVAALSREDWNTVRNYDQMLMNKVVADKQEIEIIESEDTIEAKRVAFAEAIAQLVGAKK